MGINDESVFVIEKNASFDTTNDDLQEKLDQLNDQKLSSNGLINHCRRLKVSFIGSDKKLNLAFREYVSWHYKLQIVRQRLIVRLTSATIGFGRLIEIRWRKYSMMKDFMSGLFASGKSLRFS